MNFKLKKLLKKLVKFLPETWKSKMKLFLKEARLHYYGLLYRALLNKHGKINLPLLSLLRNQLNFTYVEKILNAERQFRNRFYPNDYAAVEELAGHWLGPPRLKVSVIVASYNQKKTLKLNLLGWTQQIYPKELFEIIVSDDGSSDGTELLVDEMRGKLPYPLKFHTQEDKGFRLAKVRNEGVNLSSGDVVMFVDADTIPSPEYLWEHMKYYHVADNVAVVGMRYRIAPDVDENVVREHIEMLRTQPRLSDKVASEQVKNWRRNVLYNNVEWRKQQKVWGGFHGTIGSCRKRDYVGVGGNDETFTAYGQEDSEFAFRLMSKVQYLISNPKAIIYHLEHPDNSGKSDPKNLATYKEKTTPPKVSAYLIESRSAPSLESLNRIFAQSLSDWEFIIVLTGTCQDISFIENYYYHPKIRVLNAVGKSIGAAANLALTYARGEYVIPISEDMQIPVKTFESLAECLDSYKSLGFVMSGVARWCNKRAHHNEPAGYCPGDFLLGFIPCLPWMWRRSYFGLTEGFGDDTDFIDLEIALKLEEVGRGAVITQKDALIGQAIKTPLDPKQYFQLLEKALERRGLTKFANRLRGYLLD